MYPFVRVNIQRKPFNFRNDLTLGTIAYITIMVWVFSLTLLWVDGFTIDWAVVTTICTAILGIGLSVFGKLLHNSERIARIEQSLLDVSVSIRDIKETLNGRAGKRK